MRPLRRAPVVVVACTVAATALASLAGADAVWRLPGDAYAIREVDGLLTPAGGDVDGDGRPDLIFHGWTAGGRVVSDSVVVRRLPPDARGASRFASLPLTLRLETSDPAGIGEVTPVGDANGDGLIDLLVTIDGRLIVEIGTHV